MDLQGEKDSFNNANNIWMVSLWDRHKCENRSMIRYI